MKRHLLIATIICAATTLPASAIIKNIAINEYLSCAHVSPYGHADWVAECFQQTTDTPSLRIFGIAACSNQSGTGYSDTSDKITASYNKYRRQHTLLVQNDGPHRIIVGIYQRPGRLWHLCRKLQHFLWGCHSTKFKLSKKYVQKSFRLNTMGIIL